jgi:iron complex transport system ATP-binding protein
MTAALLLEGVHARYRSRSNRTSSEPSALVDLSLSVAPGELLAVLGPNGAGKSTLLRVMAGTLVPSAGRVELFGRDLEALDRRAIARELAVVPQVQDVAFGFSVREVVMMGRAPHQDAWMRASAEDLRIVDEALARCDLLPFAARRAHELSGGEQKRVAIARALAQRPKVLLLDEPSAFLDVRHQVQLYDLLAEEVSRQKLACVVVMHDLNVAAQYASRLALLKRGALVAIGGVEEVMTYRLLRETFDADLYVGVNDLTGARFFLPMRGKAG